MSSIIEIDKKEYDELVEAHVRAVSENEKLRVQFESAYGVVDMLVNCTDYEARLKAGRDFLSGKE